MPSQKFWELKNLREFQLDLLRNIDEFLRKTNKYVQGTSPFSLDLEKNKETIEQLDKTQSWLRDYKREVIKWSRGIKPKSEKERNDPRFRGMNDSMRGDRRTILRKLNKLEERIQWLRKQVGTLNPTGRELVMSQTIKLVEENINIDAQGKAELAPGGGAIIMIGLLFAAFYEFKLRRSRSKSESES